jgi:hypothetical protein
MELKKNKSKLNPSNPTSPKGFINVLKKWVANKTFKPIVDESIMFDTHYKYKSLRAMAML